jgi:hypothetical protein
MKCERCQNKDVPILVECTTLIGSTHAFLCLKCRNEWEQVVKSNDLWKKELELDARKKYYKGCCLAGKFISEDQWRDFNFERNKMLEKFRKLGLDFIKPLKET